MPDARIPNIDIDIEVTDEDALSPRLRDALTELAAAMADEEVTLSDEMLLELQEESEVAGFAFGNTMKVGDLMGGSLGASSMSFCGQYSPAGPRTGGSCTVFAREDEGPVDSCTIRFGK